MYVQVTYTEALQFNLFAAALSLVLNTYESAWSEYCCVFNDTLWFISI